MARTVDEIQDSLIRSLERISDDIDTQKGPIFDFLMRPVPTELSETEAAADRIARLVTIQLDQVATRSEVEAIARSFSVPLGSGRPSRGRVVFFRRSRPSQDVIIPRGTLVGTRDHTFTFAVRNDNLIMSAGNADAFYNPSRRRFEIFGDVEATSVGEDFDLPARRISEIINGVDGIDGVINLERTSGGLGREPLSLSIARVRSKFRGLDPESGGGIESDIRNRKPDQVTGVSLVYPKDHGIFRRRTNRPAIDVYINGSDPEIVSNSFLASGGEGDIILESPPVLSVDTVQVNGVNVDFVFLEDQTKEVGGSVRGEDRIVLTDSLDNDDVVDITYETDSLIRDLQNDLFSDTSRIFDTDILVRRRRVVDLVIEITATVLPSFDTNRTGESVERSVFRRVQQNSFGIELHPEVLRQQIKDDVGGLSELRMKRFQRKEGSVLDVEVITLEKNEVARIDQESLIIDMRR